MNHIQTVKALIKKHKLHLCLNFINYKKTDSVYSLVEVKSLEDMNYDITYINIFTKDELCNCNHTFKQEEAENNI